jgi:U2 small nuclear ribonucleoprotein B''
MTKKEQPTLYIRNLNEKVRIQPLKSALEAIFSQFGKVIDIKVKRNIRHRGQAFVSFETSEIATKAMIKSQRFPLFDKPMVFMI